MADKQNVILGSGDLYIVEFTGEVPADSVIEVETNKIGHISGGAELEYKAEYTEVEDDRGVKVKSFLTKEEAMLKSGILSWNGKTLEKLCETARVTETAEMRTVKIGGKANANGKSYVVHFVHTLDDGKKIRVTIVGKSTNGFTIAFAKNKETIIDAEFTCLASDKDGTLIIYKEEIDAA